MSSTSSENIPLRTLGDDHVTHPLAGSSVVHTVDPSSTQGENETASSSNANKIETQGIPVDEIVVHATDDAGPMDPPQHVGEDKAPSDDQIEGRPASEHVAQKISDTSVPNGPAVSTHLPVTNPKQNEPTSSTDVLTASDKALAEYVSQCVLKGIRDIRAEGLNGWVDIAKTVNEVDDEKLENCKDDMDTLLVFAGLFSAVLTAFIVESYQTLSPDTADMTVQLLNRIAVQTNSYTITPSFMNATETTPPFDPFEPSPGNLRINRLWFASLIISLITASFGILIKQWLREYKVVLDPKYSNPRGRLRIRQFRYPGLLKWKVFEIAALLPLLMQLALGLFLLGLCLFTWSVNTSVGHYSTALVSAWIFFFIAAAFAPVISSNCPFKISLLSPILPILRAWVSRIWTFKWTYIGPHICATGPRPRTPDRTIFWTIVITIFSILEQIFALLSYFIPSPLSRIIKFISEPVHNVACIANDILVGLEYHPDPWTIPLEEREVAKNEDKDLEVLSTVDNAILDDEHLTVTMRSIIAQSQFPPEDIVNFATQALQRRLPQLGAYGTDSALSVPDFRLLPPRSTQMLVDITFGALQRHSISLESQSSEILSQLLENPTPRWICNAVAIIIASGIGTSRLILTDTSPLLSHYRVSLPTVPRGLFANMPLKDIWEHLRHLSPSLVEDPMVVSRIVQARYCHSSCRHDSPPIGPYSHHPPPEDKSTIQAILLELLHNTILHGKGPSEPLTQLFHVVVSWCYNVPGSTDVEFISQLLEMIRTTPGEFTKCLFTPSKGYDEAFKRGLLQLVAGLPASFKSADAAGRTVLLHVLIFAIHYNNLVIRVATDDDAYFAINSVSALCDEAIKMYGFATEGTVEHEEEWTVVLYLLNCSIRTWSGSKKIRTWTATEILMKHWVHDSAAFASFGKNPSLLPYWNCILESLHMCMYRFHDKDYRDSNPNSWHKIERPCCDRAAGDVTVKFNQAALDQMKDNGWPTADNTHDAAGGDASGAHVVDRILPGDVRKLKTHLARILHTTFGIQPNNQR